jgi:hypothetical protein
MAAAGTIKSTRAAHLCAASTRAKVLGADVSGVDVQATKSNGAAVTAKGIGSRMNVAFKYQSSAALAFLMTSA